MVKILWQLKKAKGDSPEKKEYEIISSGDILCDRAVIVSVNKHGDCGMALQGLPVTEALGGIRYCLDSDVWSGNFAPKTVKEVTLAIDIYPDEAQPNKVEHLEYLRGVILTLKAEEDDIDVHFFNITRYEGKGILEMTLMLQLLTMGMQNAMRQVATGPRIPGQVGPQNWPGGKLPPLRF